MMVDLNHTHTITSIQHSRFINVFIYHYTMASSSAAAASTSTTGRVPLDVIMSCKSAHTTMPPEFGVFIAKLKDGSYGRKALIGKSTGQSRTTVNQPPSVRTIIVELINRMSPDAVSRTIDTISKLTLNSQDDLNLIASYIFKFATIKQNYKMALAYAQLVHGLINLHFGTDVDNKLVVIILRRCSEAFTLEAQSELVDRSTIDDGIGPVAAAPLSESNPENTDSRSNNFKRGLVQFIAALNEVTVFADDLYDAAIAQMLDCTNSGASNAPPYDARIETAAFMAGVPHVVNRYRTRSPTAVASECVLANIAVFRAIEQRKIAGVSTKARFAVSDTLDLFKK